MPTIYSIKRVARLTLYVPERDRSNNPIRNLKYWRREAIVLLSKFSGTGATRLSGRGASIGTETGRLQHEPVNILYVDIGRATFNARKDELLAFMERFGSATGQDFVMAEYDGSMHIIRIKRGALPRQATPRRR